MKFYKINTEEGHMIKEIYLLFFFHTNASTAGAQELTKRHQHMPGIRQLLCEYAACFEGIGITAGKLAIIQEY